MNSGRVGSPSLRSWGSKLTCNAVMDASAPKKELVITEAEGDMIDAIEELGETKEELGEIVEVGGMAEVGEVATSGAPALLSSSAAA